MRGFTLLKHKNVVLGSAAAVVYEYFGIMSTNLKYENGILQNDRHLSLSRDNQRLKLLFSVSI